MMFDGAIGALVDRGYDVGPILRGLLSIVCHMGSTVVAACTGIIALAGSVLCDIASKAWSMVESVTGFVWSMLVTAASNAVTWGAVISAGGAVVTVNPLIGGLVAAIGSAGVLLAS